ncbi:hypothetical protein CIPAW_12G060400 [Carya illinoinensis]|uniref:Uncharacterized protein n=1 Tax=Carya illinoinensis TaxID=32201 RepID=A0A8T1NNI0_CARIL|nr:hypothetical protein CIPAW_12G060400 [Carya illinoinensis]
MTSATEASLSLANWNRGGFRTPKPPPDIGRHTCSHLTKWNLNSSPKPPHKKSRWSFSIRTATLAGKLESVLFINVVLPPFDKYNLFHPANLLSIFSITESHTADALEALPKGSPK